jgi:hypothetical protein
MVMIRNETMLRWTLSVLLTLTTVGTVSAADLPPYAGRRAHAPVYAAAPPPPPVYVEDPALISPPTTPILMGSSTLPGYYGRPFNYYYQGDYYGGPYEPTGAGWFFRLPYACGVYGYC